MVLNIIKSGEYNVRLFGDASDDDCTEEMELIFTEAYW